MWNYGDLVNRPPWEPSKKHPRMPVEDRAKIFMPYAALRGFQGEIAERQRQLSPRPAPGEAEQEAVNAALNQAAACLAAKIRPRVLAVVFEEERPGWGNRREVEGTLKRLDLPRGLLSLEEETLPLEDLVSLELLSDAADFISEGD